MLRSSGDNGGAQSVVEVKSLHAKPVSGRRGGGTALAAARARDLLLRVLPPITAKHGVVNDHVGLQLNYKTRNMPRTERRKRASLSGVSKTLGALTELRRRVRHGFQLAWPRTSSARSIPWR